MRKTAILAGCTLLFIVFMIVVVLLGVNTPAGQRIITGRVNSYLQKKLNVPIQIDHIGIRIPDWVALEGIYIPDLQQDTLVAGDKLYINLDMWALIKGNIGINAIEAEGIRAKVIRQVPDTTFNYQFIIDAFDSGTPPDPADTVSTPLNMRLDEILLKNVSFTYQDDATGMEAQANIPEGNLKFDAFNTSYMRFHPDNVSLEGAKVSLFTYHPKVKIAEEQVAPNPNDTLDIRLGKLTIKDFVWQYEDEISGLKNGVTLNYLEGGAEKVFLAQQYVSLNPIIIDGLSTYVTFDKVETPTPPDTANSATDPGWTVTAKELNIKNTSVEFNDNTVKPIPQGTDFSHLHIRDLTTQLTAFQYSSTAIAGKLEKLSFIEKSGLQLLNAETEFAYTETGTFLKNFRLKTPQSDVAADAALEYNNMSILTQQPGKIKLDILLDESKLAYKDVLLLMPDFRQTPPFGKQPNGYIGGKARLKGSVDNLNIEQANFSTGSSTNVDVTGQIAGLPATEKLIVDLQVNNFSSTEEDLKQFLPDSTLPSDFRLPETIALNGTVKGKIEDLLLDAHLLTSAGNAGFSGQLINVLNPDNLVYNGKLDMDSLNLGYLLNIPPQQLGTLSMSVEAEGTGIDPSTMEATLKGTIKQASIQQYTYNNLTLDGSIKNGVTDFQARIDDENLRMQLTGHSDISREFPDLKLDAEIAEFQLKPLNLYADSVGFRGTISADFSSLNPDNPLGSVVAENIVVTDAGKPIPVGNVTAILAQEENGNKSATIDSPMLTARMNGNYSYPELAEVVSHEISKYFEVADTTLVATHTVAASRFRFQAKAFYHPVLKVFVPALSEMDTISLAARVDNQSDTSMLFRIIAPHIEYDSMKISQTRFGLAGTGEKAIIRGSLGEFQTAGFRIRKAGINGDMANNQISFDFVVRDSLDKRQHGFSGQLAIDNRRYRFGLTKDIMLNYIGWEPQPNGSVEYDDQGLIVKDFGLSKTDGEQLLISSVRDSVNAPIRIMAKDIQIGPLVTMVLQDSTLADGTLNGDIRIRNYTEEHIIFGGNLGIKDLQLTQIPIGDLNIRATNRNETKIQLIATLQNEDNDLNITGNYAPEEKLPLDFKIALRKLSAKTIEAFSFGELTQSKGQLTGDLTLKGSTEKPAINGSVKFDEVAFRVNQLGAIYQIPNSNLTFAGQNVNFNNFIVTDAQKQELKVNGNLDISTIPDVGYNLTINTRNFTALNSTRKDNDMFFGKGIVNADLRIKGRGSESVIEGDVKLISGSNVTIIMPDDASAATGEGIVEFINPNETVAITEDSVNTTEAPVIGFASEMNLNLEADDKSEFTIVVDELNGDQLKVKGNAQLNTGIAPNGQLFLLGLYELTEGSYDLSLEVLKKQFMIRKGSQLLWTGDPMKADIDITAVYPITADLSQLSSYGAEFGKTPLNVLLKIQGNLTAPVIKFEIEAQSDILSRNVVNKINDNILTQLNNNSSEVNKQAFALLVMNRFITEQTGTSSGGLSAEGIARQSVSQLLSDQLNLLASDLVKGVNVNFDLNSSTEGGKARTDLNVGLSKGFLNDRLTIAVGRNFEIENSGNAPSSTEIFDNISVNYALTRDGRYMVRAYRKNQFQTVLEGYVVETGVSFVVTMDYDAFREIFQKSAGGKNGQSEN